MATEKNTYGPNNMRITEKENTVTLEFDPRVVIGRFKKGSEKICSTGSYRALDASGCKIMVHVIGPGEIIPTVTADETEEISGD